MLSRISTSLTAIIAIAMASLYVCASIWYWLLKVWHAFKWLSWCNAHLCGYHIYTDVFMSMFACLLYHYMCVCMYWMCYTCMDVMCVMYVCIIRLSSHMNSLDLIFFQDHSFRKQCILPSFKNLLTPVYQNSTNTTSDLDSWHSDFKKHSWGHVLQKTFMGPKLILPKMVVVVSGL